MNKWNNESWTQHPDPMLSGAFRDRPFLPCRASGSIRMTPSSGGRGSKVISAFSGKTVFYLIWFVCEETHPLDPRSPLGPQSPVSPCKLQPSTVVHFKEILMLDNEKSEVRKQESFCKAFQSINVWAAATLCWPPAVSWPVYVIKSSERSEELQVYKVLHRVY